MKRFTAAPAAVLVWAAAAGSESVEFYDGDRGAHKRYADGGMYGVEGVDAGGMARARAYLTPPSTIVVAHGEGA